MVYLKFLSLVFLLSFSSQAEDKFDILVRVKGKLNLNSYQQIKSTTQRRKSLYKNLVQFSTVRQQHIWSWLKQNNIKFKPFYIDNYIAVYDMTQSQINQLAKLKGIQKLQHIKPHRHRLLVRNPGLPAPRNENMGINIEYIQAPKVWKELKITGKGIVIAGQDSGIDFSHPALLRQYRGYSEKKNKVNHHYSWHDAIHKPLTNITNKCGMSSKVPCDDHAHGTHTIGTAVGYGGADKTIGVAPQAKWIGCRNMDNLTGSVTTYLECFEFFFAPYPVGGDSFTQGRVELAPDIINNSWACPNKEGCEGDEFIHTLKVLKLSSIMVVSAAGNSGDRCSSMDMTPAHNSGLSLRVGGLNQPYKRVFGLSSRGPSKFDGGTGPEVIAPATFIVSSTPKGRYAGQFWSGTSMAAPHVAGLVALIWQASPKLKGNIEQTIELIQKSATPFPWNQNCGDIPGDKFPNNIVGSGVINAYKAVQMALRIK